MYFTFTDLDSLAEITVHKDQLQAIDKILIDDESLYYAHLGCREVALRISEASYKYTLKFLGGNDWLLPNVGA